MKTNKIHYCYKITNLNPTDERLYYIGVRSTSKPSPELDTTYQSSSKYLKEAIKEIGHKNFKKEIISVWETRKLAVQEEIRLHNKFDVAKNPLFYNKSKQTTTGFDTTGVSYNLNKLSVLNINTNTHLQIHTEELFYDYYLPEANGKVSVIDLDTNTTKQVTKKEFEAGNYCGVTKNQITVIDLETNSNKNIALSDFNKNKNKYTTPTTGFVTVIDKSTNTIKNIPIDEFRNNKHSFEHITKNTVSVIDKYTGEKLRVHKDIYHSNERYVNCRSKKINIYDSMGNLVFKTYGNFKEICNTHNLPFGELTKSYQSNTKIYSDSSPRKVEWFQYKNWYSKELS